MGNNDFGIDLDTINSITEQIAKIHKMGLSFLLLLEGEYFRGISASSFGMDRSSADYTGMMAT